MAEAKVYIEGEIVSRITEDTTFPCTLPSDVRAQLEYQKPFDSIRAIINTPGGSANAGLAIKDDLLSFGVPVHTCGIGFVGSIGTAIYAAGTTRELSKHCKFFIHLPHGGINGTADEILAYGEATKQLENELIDTYVSLTGQPRELLTEMCRKQTELSAQQALELGFATSITQEVMAKLTDLPAAKSKQQINQNEKMNAEETKEVKGLLQDLSEKFNKLFGTGGRKEAKALALTITETGQAITIEGETEAAETGQAVTVTETGEALADGTYKLSNGQTITVEGGKISAVTSEESEAKTEDEEVKALREKLTALETENATLKTAKAEAEVKAQKAEGEAKAQAEEMKALKTDFEAFRGKLETSGFIPRDENSKREETKASNKTGREAALERRLTKNKK